MTEIMFYHTTGSSKLLGRSAYADSPVSLPEQTKEGRLSESENALWCWRGGEVVRMPDMATIGSF